jgi:hypothetical protein
MNKRETVLALAAVTGTAAAFLFRHQLNEERALTAQLRAQPPVAAPAPQPIVLSTVSKVTVTPSPAVTSDTAVPPPGPRFVAGRKEEWQSAQRQLLKDPRYLDALRAQRRLTYRLRRDNAMRLFGFSAATADAVVDLDIDSEIQMMSLDPAGSGEDLRKQYEAVQRDHDTRMLALLGRDRFDHWQNYMETRGTRMQVDRYRSQLNGADLLREDQVEPLITALAVDQKQMRTEIEEYRDSLSWEGNSTESTRRFRERQLEIMQAANKRMLASAASILSSSQVKRLADMLSADIEQRATQDRIESLRRKIGPAPAPDAAAD